MRSLLYRFSSVALGALSLLIILGALVYLFWFRDYTVTGRPMLDMFILLYGNILIHCFLFSLAERIDSRFFLRDVSYDMPYQMFATISFFIALLLIWVMIVYYFFFVSSSSFTPWGSALRTWLAVVTHGCLFFAGGIYASGPVRKHALYELN